MNNQEEKRSRVKDSTYLLVWAGLVLLTGVTVSVAGRELGRLTVWVALTIAALKSGLVLSYFMHLKYERGMSFFKLIIPGMLLILTLLIGLTFFDVAFR